MHSVTNHPACSAAAFPLPLQRDRRLYSFLYGSGFTLYEEVRRTTRPNCVRYPRIRSGASSTDYLFASGRSPPRLTTTKLPSATGIGHNPRVGLSPPKSRLGVGALILAKAGIQTPSPRRDCVAIHFIGISTPSHAVIPSGARNLIIVLRAGSGRNLYDQ
jgi:hypothetical protein